MEQKLTPFSLAFIALRIFAIFIVYRAIDFVFNSAGITLGVFSESIDARTLLLFGAFIVPSLILFGFFWCKTQWLAERIVRPLGGDHAPISHEGLLQVGFCLVGIFIFTSAFPPFIGSLISIFTNPDMTHVNYVSEYAQIFIDLLLAVWLLVGAPGALHMIQKIRAVKP